MPIARDDLSRRDSRAACARARSPHQRHFRAIGRSGQTASSPLSKGGQGGRVKWFAEHTPHCATAAKRGWTPTTVTKR
jgi:hypothetical protein